MIYKNDCTLSKEYLEQLTEEGLESLPEMIRTHDLTDYEMIPLRI